VAKVYRTEGLRALYGGLVPHLIKTVPNAAVMFAVYELVVVAYGWLRDGGGGGGTSPAERVHDLEAEVVPKLAESD
jgi:hypothetical protein